MTTFRDRLDRIRGRNNDHPVTADDAVGLENQTMTENATDTPQAPPSDAPGMEDETMEPTPNESHTAREQLDEALDALLAAEKKREDLLARAVASEATAARLGTALEDARDAASAAEAAAIVAGDSSGPEAQRAAEQDREVSRIEAELKKAQREAGVLHDAAETQLVEIDALRRTAADAVQAELSSLAGFDVAAAVRDALAPLAQSLADTVEARRVQRITIAGLVPAPMGEHDLGSRVAGLLDSAGEKGRQPSAFLGKLAEIAAYTSEKPSDCAALVAPDSPLKGRFDAHERRLRESAARRDAADNLAKTVNLWRQGHQFMHDVEDAVERAKRAGLEVVDRRCVECATVFPTTNRTADYCGDRCQHRAARGSERRA